MLYPVTPTLSFEAFHDRSTWPGVAPLAVRLVGVVGAVVSAVVWLHLTDPESSVVPYVYAAPCAFSSRRVAPYCVKAATSRGSLRTNVPVACPPVPSMIPVPP